MGNRLPRCLIIFIGLTDSPVKFTPPLYLSRYGRARRNTSGMVLVATTPRLAEHSHAPQMVGADMSDAEQEKEDPKKGEEDQEGQEDKVDFPTADELSDGFFRDAENEASRRGLTLAPRVSDELRRAYQRAADDIIQRSLSSPAPLDALQRDKEAGIEATHTLFEQVDVMIRRSPGFARNGELTEDAFNTVKSLLCPFWFFC